mgnify:CR=1 FL=1
MLRLFLLFSISFTFLTSSPNQFNEYFIKVADQGRPSIVSIISEKTEQIQKMPNFFFFDPFEFEDPFRKEERKAQSLGSGVILDKEKGYIITNSHVIDGADEIKVILQDKREFIAKIIGTDPLSDVAIIKIDADSLIAVKTGDSNKLQIGEWVIAIGSPFGLHLNNTVTAGIVSAVGRSDIVSKAKFENFIQHDAAINPGNSGGALFNLSGELIGINTAIATDGYSRSNAGVGFAIPINQAKRVIEDLVDGGIVLRGYLGVSINDVDENTAKVLGLKNKKGAFITSVVKNEPAENAGIKEKDVITAMNSIPIENSTDLRNKVSNLRPSETVVFSIIRNELLLTIPVRLGTRPSEEELAISYMKDRFDLLGLLVNDNNDGSGVVILDVDPKSEIFKNDVRKGDIITEIGKIVILNQKDYNNELKKYKVNEPIMIRITNNGLIRYIAFLIK